MRAMHRADHPEVADGTAPTLCVAARAVASSKQPRSNPSAEHAVLMRPYCKPMGTIKLSAAPGFPRTPSAGMITSGKSQRAQGPPPGNPASPVIGSIVRPAESRGSKTGQRAVSQRPPTTRNRPAICPWEIQVFCPSSR